MLKLISTFDANCYVYCWHHPSHISDGTKQAEPVGCNGIYQSKTIFFQAECLGAYVHILFFSYSNVFHLAVKMLLCLPPTGSYCLTNIAKLGLFESYKYYIYFSIELDLFIYLGVYSS